MKIETFALCYNEERMMHYFLRHYLQYGSVTIFDNHSTDNSVKIAEANGVNIFQYDSGGEFREDILTHIRNICWKESTADWVIVTDIDEFVYHNDLIKILSESPATVLLPRMFNMFSETFPQCDGQIYDEVKYGVEFQSKMCIFRPSEIREMNYEPGCHFARPEGNFILDFTTPIINLHFKNIGLDYVIERNQMLSNRLSAINRENHWGWHYTLSREEVIIFFTQQMQRLIKVI